MIRLLPAAVLAALSGFVPTGQQAPSGAVPLANASLGRGGLIQLASDPVIPTSMPSSTPSFPAPQPQPVLGVRG